jgi:hypothetical protein
MTTEEEDGKIFLGVNAKGNAVYTTEEEEERLAIKLQKRPKPKQLVRVVFLLVFPQYVRPISDYFPTLIALHLF